MTNHTTNTPGIQPGTPDDFFTKVRNSVRSDNRLDGNAKILLGMIESLAVKEGYCWSSNEYLAEAFDVSKATIRRWVQQIEAAGYIRIFYTDCKKGTERRIHMADLPPAPRDCTPQTVAAVLTGVAMGEAKGDRPRGANSATPLRSATPGVPSLAGQPSQVCYPRGVNSATQLDTVLDSGKEERKESLSTPLPPTHGGTPTASPSGARPDDFFLSSQEKVRQEAEARKQQEEALAHQQAEAQARRADERLFRRAFNETIREHKDNPLPAKELDRMVTARYEELRAEKGGGPSQLDGPAVQGHLHLHHGLGLVGSRQASAADGLS